MNTRDLIFGSLDLVKQQAKAMASTVSLAKPYLPQKLTEMSTGDLVAGLGHVKNQATVMVTTRDGAVGAAALVIGSALSAYFLWPAAAAPAAAGAVMKAPGTAGFFISRAAFAANPQLYYQILRKAGAAAAVAAFSPGAAAFVP